MWAAALILLQNVGQQRFDTTVSRVRLDVIVSDRSGRFVDTLEAQDFSVYEDGELQQILDVQLIDLPVAADRRMDRADDGTTEVQVAVPITGQGALVFVIDGLNIGHRSKSRFARRWLEFQKGSGLPDVPQAAYLIDSLGRIHELAPLTLDPEAMRIAAERALGEPREADIAAEEFVRLRRMMLLPSPLDGISVAIRTYEALAAVCNSLATLTGRKTLVWVSTGSRIFEQLTPSNRDLAGQTVDRRLTRQQAAFHEAANTAGVSIYGLDPTLVTWRRNRSITGSVGPVDRILRDPLERNLLAIDAKRDTLFHAARQTGGKAFPYAGDIPRVIRAIEEDSRRYYILTYATPEPLGDGLYHETRVQVTDSRLNVRTRAGYVDLPAGAQRLQALAARTSFASSANDFQVLARAYRRWDRDGQPVVQLAVGVAPSDDMVGPAAAWDYFHVVAVDANQQIQDQAHVEIRAADGGPHPTSAAVPFVFAHDLALPRGVYDVRIAIEGRTNHRIGTTQLDIEVPEAAAWQTSDLILAAQVASAPETSRPLLDDQITLGEDLVAYVEVAGGVQPILTASVSAPTSQLETEQLPPVELVKDRVGIHRGALWIQFDQTGDYILRIEIVDQGKDKRRVFEAPIAVADRRTPALLSVGPRRRTVR